MSFGNGVVNPIPVGQCEIFLSPPPESDIWVNHLPASNRVSPHTRSLCAWTDSGLKMRTGPLCLTLSVLSLNAADVFQAIRANDLATLNTPNIDTRDTNGVTPLLYASAAGSTPLLRATRIPARAQ